MTTALVFICTGKDYWKYLKPAIDGAKKFFPSDILLFTDSTEKYDVTKQVQIEHKGWPDVTLMRYHTILTEKEWLSQYDYVFYLDVDMQIIKTIPNDIYADGLTVVLHPSFVGQSGTPEIAECSTAYLPINKVKYYVMGSFQGGTSKSFLKMAETISNNIDKDKEINFIARWHDESHLNRYIHDNVPAKILSPDYACRPNNISSSTYIITIDKGTPDRPAINEPFDLKAFQKLYELVRI